MRRAAHCACNAACVAASDSPGTQSSGTRPIASTGPPGAKQVVRSTWKAAVPGADALDAMTHATVPPLAK
jgi:hypothetical protein